jgi:ABC-type cobalamin/Fe3+-siderophores transport system ATPase subunit
MLSSRTQDISKGELQRTILAFSLLYGSEYLLMDEPIFALEDYQKKRALAYITRFTREHNLGLLYSVHELELSEKYSDKLLLFSKDTPPLLGPTADIFKPELIEKAYTVPFAMLKTKETIYRESLKGYT